MAKKKEDKLVQPEANIGLIGHIDHGKTTLLERLSGVWADTHSEEIKRGITIRLGYANTTFYKCSNCDEEECYGVNKKCKACNKECKPLRKVSFIDAPGHETLMATMLAGASIMDGALLLIAANEECPQPQTREHLMALNLTGIKHIVIVQNKIDLVSEEDALKNYKQIKEFVKGTIAEKAPVIPISAQHNVNIGALVKAIEENIKTPKRDLNKDPLVFIARSFDINKPGTDINKLQGGVLGGALVHGKLKNKDKIEIKPGLKIIKEGKEIWKPIETEIAGLKTGNASVNEVHPGGSLGILTTLDPSMTKSNSLSGNVVSLKGKLPSTLYDLDLKITLLEKVLGLKEAIKVDSIKIKEPLLLNVYATATVGFVDKVEKEKIHVSLKVPVCVHKHAKLAISRKFGARWRLIGIGEII